MKPIGHNNFVNDKEVVGVVDANSSPSKKLRHKAEAERMLVNATGGRKARSLIVMASNHIVLSALQPATLMQRISGAGGDNEQSCGGKRTDY